MGVHKNWLIGACITNVILLFLYFECWTVPGNQFDITVLPTSDGDETNFMESARLLDEEPTLDDNDGAVLLVNAWVGGPMPSYFPHFIETVRRNPTVSFLLISTFDTPEFCPSDGSTSLFFPPSNPNMRVHCSSTEDLVRKSSAALCHGWRCSAFQRERVRQHFTDYVALDGQAFNNMKPVYATIFKKQFESMFPSRTFSHWIRVDLDLFLGNWDNLFPTRLLAYDVFTFFPGSSMNWQYIYLKGYLSGFRLSPRIDLLWLSIRMFRSPESFCDEFPGNHVRFETSAADEGAMSVNIFRDHPEVSVIVEPGLLASDIDLTADRDQKIILFADHADILRVPKRTKAWQLNAIRRHRTTHEHEHEHNHLHTENLRRSSSVAAGAAEFRGKSHDEQGQWPASAADGKGEFLGTAALTNECLMSWLQPRDRLCLAHPESHALQRRLASIDRHHHHHHHNDDEDGYHNDDGRAVRVVRETGSAVMELYAVPGSARRSESGSHMLAYHLQVSKREGLRYSSLPRGARLEIFKDDNHHWVSKQYNRFGAVAVTRSELPWSKVVM